MIPRVKTWRVVVEQTEETRASADVPKDGATIRRVVVQRRETKRAYGVLAPTRMLAILNLRGAGVYGPVLSAGVCHKKRARANVEDWGELR